MSKNIPDSQIDVALNDIKSNADVMHGCSSQPADYAGIAAVSLGAVALDSDDFTVGDGDTSGRKITVSEQSVTWSGSGTCNHIVIADSVAEVIKGITTIAAKSVSASGTDSIEAFDLWEINDPT